jgi:predicted deacetylase
MMDYEHEAKKALDRAENIRNADSWQGDRDAPTQYQLSVAIANALLALNLTLCAIEATLKEGR